MHCFSMNGCRWNQDKDSHRTFWWFGSQRPNTEPMLQATQKGINYALATRATMTFSSSDQKTTFQTKEGERVLVSSTSVHKKLKILKESQRRVGFLGSYHTLGFYDWFFWRCNFHMTCTEKNLSAFPSKTEEGNLLSNIRTKILH